MVNIPSPAVAIVGRHNSGKTTLIEALISELAGRGLDVGSVKHHSHVGFEIDYPGKDSYRHRAAGATETVISSPGQMACIRTVSGEMECSDIVDAMPGHDIVIVEGYRKSALPTIEIMRSGNDADRCVAAVFAQGARCGWSLDTDFVQVFRDSRSAGGSPSDIVSKMPGAGTVAIVTDIAEAVSAAAGYNIPAFALDDIVSLADFISERFARPKITVCIQAGGESKRMGRSKATVPFAGRPLICRIVERMRPVADEMIITTNEPENLGFLEELYADVSIKLVRDVFDYRGALPGLYTALQAASNPYVAVIACDMVFASASLVIAEALELKKTSADVVVPVNKHGYEPFHAVYLRDGCLPAINSALKSGHKRAQSFFDKVEVCEFPQSRVLKTEPCGGCFINANTPEELRVLEDRLSD